MMGTKLDNVSIFGGWGTTSGGVRKLNIRAEDPVSGAMMLDLELTEAQVLNVLSNSGPTVGGTAEIYNLENYGKQHALATVTFELTEARRNDFSAAAQRQGLLLGHPGWSIPRSPTFNHHQVSHRDGKTMYKIVFHGYFDQGVTVDDLKEWDVQGAGRQVDFRFTGPKILDESVGTV